MNKTLILASAFIAPLVSANVYQNAVTTLENAPAEVKAVMKAAPTSYEFNSQFTRSSSVSYTGQVFRNVLMNDIKGAMTSQTRGGYEGTVEEAKNMILSYYNYNENTDLIGQGVIDGFSQFTISPKGLNGSSIPAFEIFYSDIQSPGKDLYSKLAGVDNPLRRGKLFGLSGFNTPEEVFNAWFEAYAKNAVEGAVFSVPNGSLPAQKINAAHISEEGLDYAQLTQKFLYGAVSYSQAARDYLSTDLGPTKGLNADNTKPAKAGAAYTAMEHHFDEGFGYFGAARDYLAYTDSEARNKLSRDTDNDGMISILTEYNGGIAPNAARVDLTAADQNLDLNTEIMTAFLQGRELITKKPADYKKYVVAQAQVVLSGWEKVLAAITIHYINVTLKEYTEYGTQEYLFKDFVKFWGEMKGFALAFQFSPQALMADATFDEVHALMGDKPVLPHATKEEVASYMAGLEKARELMRKTYNFSVNNTLNW
jgi:hypothetical protein